MTKHKRHENEIGYLKTSRTIRDFLGWPALLLYIAQTWLRHYAVSETNRRYQNSPARRERTKQLAARQQAAG